MLVRRQLYAKTLTCRSVELLMQNSKRSHQSSSTPAPAKKTPSHWSDALWPYAEHPERYGKDVVIDYDTKLVVIRDQYPKVRLAIG
jgi:hypothetical protein